MGQCIYCGQPAGFLRRAHGECKQRNTKGRAEIISLVRKAGLQSGALESLEASIARVAEANRIHSKNINELVIAGWEQSVEDAFADGILSEEEETALIQLMQHFSLPQERLHREGALDKVIKGAVLRDVLNEDLQDRIPFDSDLPFNLQKSEKLVWVFPNVDYYELKTRTHYVGGSQGFSVRIARGLYYRTSGFKGERVQSSETVHADSGIMGVTNKHIYFVGTENRFRIAYSKIVSFEAFTDGIGLQKDSQRAKPQSFVTGDGWFTYNLITNLARL